MALKRAKKDISKSHRFGGDWTTEKLDVIAEYLASYTKALKNQPFRKAYIDAFAGTGYRDARRSDLADGESKRGTLLFPDLAKKEPQKLLDGSSRRALQTNPQFDRYIYIEQDTSRCAQLAELKSEFPQLAKDISIRNGDANSEIQDLCDKKWDSHRAVLFLDPYGMQVEWKTIEAIAHTEAIDLWLLFPLGIGVNRLLTRSGDIPDSWRKRLNILLGTDDWYEEFYRVEREPTLFGDAEHVVKATTETIGRYFNDRLRSVFADVAEHPRVLRNSTNCPLFLLCFAVGNKRGAPVALGIANHLLERGAT
jgi:three-Cys-motif partner protein